MNWDDGRLLLAIARAGQMLGAAQKLGLNQSTLSRRISQLEHQLGTQLIIRRTNGCHLTPAGESFVQSLERVETEFFKAQSEFQDTGMDLSGTVRIGAPDGFGLFFLSPHIGAFTEKHKKLNIQIVPAPRSFSLAQREADIAIMVGRPEKGRLVARKLSDYGLGIYASKDYCAKFGTPKQLQDLSAHRLIGFVDDLVYSPQLNYHEDFTKSWPAQLQISSATGQLQAVKAGAGIGILHDYLAAQEPELTNILQQHRAQRTYWIAWHETVRDMARIQAVAQFIINLTEQHKPLFMAK